MMMHDDAHPLTEVPDPVPDPQSDAGRREWLGLAVLALPTLLLSLDISVLYLALPHLSADLGADSTEQLWIMDVYTFMLAGFLITMGGLGDRIGRRKLLLIGATAFGVASAVAAYATSPEMLIATRALMGIAGATLMPSTLALITNMFANVQQRARAIGVWASCMMVGAAIGPVVGGVLLDAFWWGSVFLMGVPVMVLLLVVAPVLLPEFRETSAGAVDPTSVALSLITILAVVYGLKEIAHTGVQALPVAAIAVGLIVAAIFARRQRRLTNPLLDLRLFRNRSLSIALGIIVVGGVLLSGIFLLISQHLQLVNGLTASAAGLWLAPVGLSVALGAMTAPSIARRMHPGHVIAAGLALSAIGCLLLTLVDSTGGLSLLVAGIIVVYLGVGPAMALGVDLVVGSAPTGEGGSDIGDVGVRHGTGRRPGHRTGRQPGHSYLSWPARRPRRRTRRDDRSRTREHLGRNRRGCGPAPGRRHSAARQRPRGLQQRSQHDSCGRHGHLRRVGRRRTDIAPTRGGADGSRRWLRHRRLKTDSHGIAVVVIAPVRSQRIYASARPDCRCLTLAPSDDQSCGCHGREREQCQRGRPSPEPEAKRMSCVVKVDAHILLRLMVSERGTASAGVCARSFEIVDADLKMHHHLLVRGAGGPDRSGVERLGLKRQPHSAVGIPHRDPVRLLDRNLPTQELLVETCESTRVRRTDVDVVSVKPWVMAQGPFERDM